MALGALAARLPVPWLLIEPGRAIPVRVAVAPGRSPTATSYWMVTVAARPARLGDAWSVLTNRHQALVPAGALGGRTQAEVKAVQRRALAASQEAAVRAAASLLGIRPPPALRFGLPRDVAGPSGGLALGLAAVDALTPGRLAGGWRVGATGTISAAGRVGPVEGLAQKRAAAAAAGLDVLFVPAEADADEQASPPPRRSAGPGPAGSPGLRVVPVASLAEAVAWLCRHGGQGPPCG
ncbi:MULTISPECIES: S16 family serine protease [Thermaerobacter]|uniref:S16 family serine protease n=1 Tax=Thermaerobacter composti TaxID=554949 RepID=A0ABZ0QR39_9FIRM|nr:MULTISPECIES: S16 family serine protease [Thermaerobacter]WPD19936.1 S16 family serine protease [Thermaerobacter composti]